MEIKKILWPTDFSESASVAEKFVISLTSKYEAEVHLLHVVEDLTQFEHYWGAGLDARHIHDMQEYGMKISRERMEELCTEKLTGCPRYHIHIVLGNPAKEILRAIDAFEVNLVVMATHGMTATFPFGSVAERVVKHSPVPVLTISPAFRAR
jgi:nucleotide-binding universal stress UspA family protein